MDHIINLFFIFLGIAGILNTTTVLIYSNSNLGNLFPGIAGIFFLLYGIFRNRILLFTQHGFGKFLRFSILLGFLFLLITFCIASCVIYSHSQQKPSSEADAVLVLGAGLNGRRVSKTLASRLDQASEYFWDNPNTLLVVSGGQGRDEEISEASAMKEYLITLGIPEEKIKMEDQSGNTRENFEYSKKLLDSYFNKEYKIVYVTNDFHIFRAGMIAEDTGLIAEGLSSPSYTPMLLNFYIREYFSLIKYYLFG